MEHKENEFELNGSKIYTQSWIPKDIPPKCLVVMVHGIAEHSGRYAGLAEHLVSKVAAAVFSWDQRGHGKSTGTRGYVERIELHLLEMDYVVQEALKQFPDLPFFVIGQSLGGALSALYCITRNVEKAAGLIISASALKISDEISPFLQNTVGVLSFLVPWMGVQQLNVEHMSGDEKVLSDYVQDPLVYHGKISARTGSEIMRSIKLISEGKTKIKLPTLVMHGAQDLICDIQGSKTFFEGISSEIKVLKCYENLKHDLFHEPDEQVFIDIIQFILERL